MNSHHPFWLMAVQMKYPCKRLTTLARVGGADFRVLAKFNHTRSAHYERVVAMYTKTRLPFDRVEGVRSIRIYGVSLLTFSERRCDQKSCLWFLRLFLRSLVWRTFSNGRPSELTWVRDWLRYCRWYYVTAMSPEVNIEQFFDAPVCKWEMEGW